MYNTRNKKKITHKLTFGCVRAVRLRVMFLLPRILTVMWDKSEHHIETSADL